MSALLFAFTLLVVAAVVFTVDAFFVVTSRVRLTPLGLLLATLAALALLWPRLPGS